LPGFDPKSANSESLLLDRPVSGISSPRMAARRAIVS